MGLTLGSVYELDVKLIQFKQLKRQDNNKCYISLGGFSWIPGSATFIKASGYSIRAIRMGPNSFSELKPMRNSPISVLRSVLLGLLIPLVASVYLLLPLPAAAVYPSGFPDQGTDTEYKNTKSNLEALNQAFPFLEVNEDGKPLTAEFVKYDLAGLDLSGADLRGALFSVTSLKSANLHGANLEDAIAYATRFDDADLSESILRNANLKKSEFDGALIEGADFTDAMLDRSVQESLCERATGKNPVTGVDTYESLDCIGLNDRYIPKR